MKLLKKIKGKRGENLKEFEDHLKEILEKFSENLKDSEEEIRNVWGNSR